MIWDQVSEKLNNDKGVCSGTRVPDMLDNARLAMKTKTQKSEPPADAKFLEHSQKDVSKLLVAISFSLDEETVQRRCSNHDSETALIT